MVISPAWLTFSRGWPPKVERVDHPNPPFSETEKKPATLRLVTALLGLGRLGRLLNELIPEPEVTGLLALMLLQESRRAARTSPERNLILLENQDRSLWNRPLIEEGVALVERALNSHRFGSYTLQAAIAAVHSQAASVAATDWSQIVLLYGALARIDSSPVVELNRAVAIAMRDGPEAGLRLIDALVAAGELAGYHLAQMTRSKLPALAKCLSRAWQSLC